LPNKIKSYGDKEYKEARRSQEDKQNMGCHHCPSRRHSGAAIRIIPMMNRYLLDTNIFVYAVADRDSLSTDVLAILEDYESVFYMSAESIKELIVAFRNKTLPTISS
jgi:hypothetical protein